MSQKREAALQHHHGFRTEPVAVPNACGHSRQVSWRAGCGCEQNELVDLGHTELSLENCDLILEMWKGFRGPPLPHHLDTTDRQML